VRRLLLAVDSREPDTSEGMKKPAHLQHARLGPLRNHRGAVDYDARYAKELGNFRIETITRVATRFLTCGDYRQGCAVTD
jgi:hypothetical protein